MIKILLDAFGGDNAPSATIEGAVAALNKDKDIKLLLTGKQDTIEKELAKYRYDEQRVEIINLPDVIAMDDIATEAIKRRQSSLAGAYWKLKNEDDISAFVTAGSTGAAIAGGQLILGRIRGVKRAALCPAIPNIRGGVTLLCDCGANAECKPVMLCQFALLASAYAKVGFGIENPKVGLLNNGTEAHKGDTLRLETFKYLSKMNGINFIGNVEGRDIMLGDCDVVVADGFSGNIALKSMEGCGKLALGLLKEEIKSGVRAKIGYVFMKKALKNLYARIDFDKYGGALLLGLKKVVVKSHGSSKAAAIAKSIAQASAICRGGLVPQIEKSLAGENWDEIIDGDGQ